MAGNQSTVVRPTNQAERLVASSHASRLVSIGKAALLANVHPETIRRYMASGLIEGVTTPGGHRRVDLSTVADAFGIVCPMEEELAQEKVNEGGLCVVFARVSSKKQEQAGDLTRQVDDLKRYASEHYAGQTVRVLKGVGSGLNDSRPEFLSLIDLIVARKVSVILVTYRERIARFGLNVIAHLAKANGVQIVETGGEDTARKELTLQEDMVQSCLAVLHCFSAKMNGARGGARSKTVPPPDFRDFVVRLAGAGMSRREIVSHVKQRRFVCLNTGRVLSEKSVRRVLEELSAGGVAVIPSTVRTFLNKRCTLGVAKQCPTAELYAAYVAHCQTTKNVPLGRDKWTGFIKRAVPNVRLENGAVTVAYGLTLKGGRPA